MSNQHSGGSEFYNNVLSIFDKAATFTDIEPGILHQIKICNSTYKFYFPVEVDGKTYTGLENILGRDWQRFSWHLAGGAWKPGVSTLRDFLRCIAARFLRNAVALANAIGDRNRLLALLERIQGRALILDTHWATTDGSGSASRNSK